jgi:putative glycosyltransferase (TIGR04348 family)
VVVLTGTDLYRDIAEDPRARFSLACADRLVVLQAAGVDALPEDLRERACCIYQSTRQRRALTNKPRRVLRAVMVGHLRAEKSPETLFGTAALLRGDEGIRLDHLGAAIDPRLGATAQQLMQDQGHYRWLGMQSHASTLRRIQRSHLLVHCSRMEGGAHAVMEAICSGTPVLASRVPGNVGMLGEDYEGYFPWGDAAALTALLRAARASQGQPDGTLARLTAQCAQRESLFAPATERAALHRLLDGLPP